MKLMLFGSMPSAIQATLTPAPVMPSDRAVGWLGLSESVLVVDRPSGSSCGVVAEQAPGMTFGVRSAGELAPRLGLCARLAAVTAGSIGCAPWMVTSGMPRATAGFALSRDNSPLDTTAAKESTSV